MGIIRTVADPAIKLNALSFRGMQNLQERRCGMTKMECAIVMAHTGICMLTGNDFDIFHRYVEKIMGRPVFTHEIGFLADEIKERSKKDFIALCKGAKEGDVE